MSTVDKHLAKYFKIQDNIEAYESPRKRRRRSAAQPLKTAARPSKLYEQALQQNYMLTNILKQKDTQVQSLQSELNALRRKMKKQLQNSGKASNTTSNVI